MNHYEFQLLPEDKTITVSEEHHDVEGLLSRTFAREFPGVRTALVCGGRNFEDRDLVFLTLDALTPQKVIEGGARGADTLAREWAKIRGKEVVTVPADWEKFGRSAGPRRNAEMLNLFPELVVAFPGGIGTNDMVHRSLGQNVRVLRPSRRELKEV